MRRLALIAVAVAIAGCGETTIDGDALEGEIANDAEQEGLIVDAVDCPSPEAEEGATFECTVTVKGEDKPLEVVQRNDDGNVEYDLGALLEGTAGNDAGGDEASIRFVMDAIGDDITALCDYATKAYRAELAKGQTCAKAVLDAYPDPFPAPNYEVSVDGDTAAASDESHTATLERQKNGSWLITDVR